MIPVKEIGTVNQKATLLKSRSVCLVQCAVLGLVCAVCSAGSGMCTVLDLVLCAPIWGGGAHCSYSTVR